MLHPSIVLVVLTRVDSVITESNLVVSFEIQMSSLIMLIYFHFSQIAFGNLWQSSWRNASNRRRKSILRM